MVAKLEDVPALGCCRHVPMILDGLLGQSPTLPASALRRRVQCASKAPTPRTLAPARSCKGIRNPVPRDTFCTCSARYHRSQALVQYPKSSGDDAARRTKRRSRCPKTKNICNLKCICIYVFICICIYTYIYIYIYILVVDIWQPKASFYHHAGESGSERDDREHSPGSAVHQGYLSSQIRDCFVP